MTRPWCFHDGQSGSVMLTGNITNGRDTLITRVNEFVTLVTRVT